MIFRSIESTGTLRQNALPVASHRKSEDSVPGLSGPSTITLSFISTNLCFLSVPNRTPNMSDYEDDMELDGPPVQDASTFSSDNTNVKGKRSAANLPVEAQDSLPWSIDPATL